MLGELNGSVRHGKNIADASTNATRATGRRGNAAAAVILKVCLEGGHVSNWYGIFNNCGDIVQRRSGLLKLLRDNNDGNSAEQKYGRVAVPKDYTN